MQTPFLGGHEVSRSQGLSDNRCINLYPELAQSMPGTKKSIGAFYGTPGLDLKATIGVGPIRGLASVRFAGGVEALFALSNNALYSLDTGFNATFLGTGAATTGPVSMVNNNTQFAYFDGSSGYSYAGGAFNAITLPFLNPGLASYQDGFVLVNQNLSNVVWQCNLNDLTTWNALNFSVADARPENVVGVAALKRQQYIFKNNSTEVWVNTGSPGFVFARLEGIFMEVGCCAPYSIARGGEALFWLSRNDDGQAVICMATGYEPIRVSNFALEFEISQLSTITDAIGFCYQEGGHLFYQLTFPTGNRTFVYDVSLGFQPPFWHERARFSNGVFSRHQANAYAFFNGQCLVGDWRNGNIYAYNLDTYTDAGEQRKWLRSWRALPKPTLKPTRFPPLVIDMTTGIGVPSPDDPQAMLRFSDDGGYNWSNEKYASVGRTGETARQVKFQRLGSTRKNSGLDRIFELSSTDQFKVGLVGATLDDE